MRCNRLLGLRENYFIIPYERGQLGNVTLFNITAIERFEILQEIFVHFRRSSHCAIMSEEKRFCSFITTVPVREQYSNAQSFYLRAFNSRNASSDLPSRICFSIKIILIFYLAETVFRICYAL